MCESGVDGGFLLSSSCVLLFLLRVNVCCFCSAINPLSLWCMLRDFCGLSCAVA